MSPGQKITVNHRQYTWPSKPVVVFCVDGSQPEYTEKAIQAGLMPNLQRLLDEGTQRFAHCIIPGFTNPNNLSIVTGQPPKVHGICGNFFYDTDADAEVMMMDPKYLWVDTLFSAFAKQGAKVAVVTAKDKLRRLLGKGLDFTTGNAVCFSAEKADEATLENNGIDNVLAYVGKPLPSVYSAELSEFIFAAGVKLLQEPHPPLLMYLSTTDYVQHKHAPGSEGANAFYAMLDGYLGQLQALGVTIALTADHGMNAKTDANGDPDVIYLQDLLDTWFGEGTTRVILPITDPYVVHHGALGSFATIYVNQGISADTIINRLQGYSGIELVLSRKEGCLRFDLPESRMGDIMVIGTIHKVFGTSPARHDLSGLKDPLRSHGGLSEQQVPFFLNRPTGRLSAERQLYNYDIFDVALNEVE